MCGSSYNKYRTFSFYQITQFYQYLVTEKESFIDEFFIFFIRTYYKKEIRAEYGYVLDSKHIINKTLLSKRLTDQCSQGHTCVHVYVRLDNDITLRLDKKSNLAM